MASCFRMASSQFGLLTPRVASSEFKRDRLSALKHSMHTRRWSAQDAVSLASFTRLCPPAPYFLQMCAYPNLWNAFSGLMEFSGFRFGLKEAHAAFLFHECNAIYFSFVLWPVLEWWTALHASSIEGSEHEKATDLLAPVVGHHLPGLCEVACMDATGRARIDVCFATARQEMLGGMLPQPAT
ncbi:hypothetical protein SCHPADRAFT_948300, partial [Schizopora paradoxa]